MKKLIFTISSLFILTNTYAQTQEQKDSIKNVSLHEVVISAYKFVEKKKNTVQKIDIISSKELQSMNAQTTADALINTGQIFVQKSQQGGGSPVLRGFEASRIQLNIDGIRMNNAIYRAGHLQNIITVDNNMLDRMEVMYGPASTIHGSDALGGVILLKTKDPKLARTSKYEVTGANALVRYSTANQEKTAGVGITFGNNQFASLTNLTFSQFEDLVQGKNGVDSIMDFWKKKFIVQHINGVDTMIRNSDPYKQVATGYKQMDLLQKFTIMQNKNIKHGFNFQLSTSSDVPRYDRLTETSGGIAKNAEWYYGPQNRTLAAYSLDIVKIKGFFSDLTGTLSHQYIEESRHNRGYKKAATNHRMEHVNVLGYNLALRHKDDRNEITIGTDAQFNMLKSTANKTDINTGAETKIDTRYPDGKNNMNLYGFFFQHTLKLDEDRVIINDGVRFNYTSLHSTLVDTAIQFKLPITDLQQKNKSLTANLGVAYMPDDNLRLTANFSSGFRSPNFDDMTKIFESVSGQSIIVPNVDLKPEYTNNFEAGIHYNDGVVDIDAYGFYTNYTNAIVTDAFTYNGKDSLLYDGAMTKVYASQNKAKAFIYGGGVQAIYRPMLHFSIYASTNYTYGRFNNDTVLMPLDHVPPITGRIGIKYETTRWMTELYSLYNGKKRLFDYNPNGEDNIQYSTPLGTPSWYTINFKTAVNVSDNVKVQAGVENILDKNYRYFASGMSAPGRNFVLAVRYNY